jgi:hypothetical protein
MQQQRRRRRRRQQQQQQQQQLQQHWQSSHGQLRKFSRGRKLCTSKNLRTTFQQ